jgi:predicted transcriptional regulator of viral defense system
MEKAGLLRRLRRGLWALDPNIEPFAVAPYLTAPFPAYVSFWSALSRHGMIEQIPRQITVASLDRARRIDTSIGTYSVHHLSPELFGGYEGSEETGYLATPEKAVFDTIYVRAASGSKAFFPELSLAADFDEARAELWTGRIAGPRLRTLVSRRLSKALRRATREDASIRR